MARFGRESRGVKWLCTLVCVLTAPAFIVSAWHQVTWISPDHGYGVQLEPGSVLFLRPSADWNCSAAQHYNYPTGWHVAPSYPFSRSDCWFGRTGNSTYTWVRIPLWLPLAACAAPAAILWYRQRRATYRVFRRCMLWLRPTRRRGPRRTLKLGLTAACAAIVILFVVSLPWAFVVQGETQTIEASVGRICWVRLGRVDLPLFAGTKTRLQCTGIHWNESWRPRWSPGIDWSSVSQELQYVQIPLWLSLLLLGLPAAFLWWSERWPGVPGRCAECGYDLTGNVSGRCPECGTAIPASPG